MNSILFYLFGNSSVTLLLSLFAVNIALSFLIAARLGSVRFIGFWGSFITGLLFSAAAALIITLLYKTKRNKQDEMDPADQFPDLRLIAYHIRRLRLLRQSGMISKQEYDKEMNRLLNEQSLR